jgi:hypothetical protein
MSAKALIQELEHEGATACRAIVSVGSRIRNR